MKSKIDTSWDVMKYKYHYELEHQWDLKKRFIEAHKDKYPEARLICLAQLYCNVHFMGCSYDESIMKLIEELSEGIAEKNAKWQKQTFVAASSAVEARVKGKLTAPQRGLQQNSGFGDSSQQPPQNFSRRPQFEQNDSRLGGDPSSKFISFVQSGNNIERSPSEQPQSGFGASNYTTQPEPANEGSTKKRPYSPVEVDEFYRNKKMRTNFSEGQIKEEVKRVVEGGPFGKVVVFHGGNPLESSVAIVERTAAAAQMNISYSYIPVAQEIEIMKCNLHLDGMLLSSGLGQGQKQARDAACKIAIERLKETSFTIQVKASFTQEGDEVGRSLETDQQGPSTGVNQPITDDNIGNKMMKLMGWGGGGLGKNKQGIEEPISAKGTVRREGLGLYEGNFNTKIQELLRNFSNGPSKDDLVFSTDFNKDERKTIHQMVRKYNLKSRSYGNDDNRRLVVFKKFKPLEIVEDLLMAGCETTKYRLLPPKSLIDRFTV